MKEIHDFVQEQNWIKNRNSRIEHDFKNCHLILQKLLPSIQFTPSICTILLDFWQFLSFLKIVSLLKNLNARYFLKYKRTHLLCNLLRRKEFYSSNQSHRYFKECIVRMIIIWSAFVTLEFVISHVFVSWHPQWTVWNCPPKLFKF